ncbi:MAG: hypothetical protein QNJ98_00700 [Planctomycetota bacterium]|nr:hypothetical protein [Planctomycetota bacterium]
MKTHPTPYVAIGMLLCMAGICFAGPEAELQKKYEEKIAKPFVAHGGWSVDYDEARERAAKEQKLIFTYFTRSYAR